MRKLVLTITSALLAVSLASAQDLAQATDLYNTGATYLSTGNLEGALDSFQQAYQMGLALGDEGQEVVENCKNIIPDVSLNVAKSLAQKEDYDGAVKALESTVALAKEFGNQDVETEAQTLIPQLTMQKGTKMLNDKNFTEAAAAFKQVLEMDPDNGVAALRLGMALASAGDSDGAIEAFALASEHGQADAAGKQLGNLYLRSALAAFRAKDYSKAVADAKKSLEYSENSQAYRIAGQASQQAGNTSAAISYFEKYLELSPSAQDSGAIAYTVGALYQTSGNVAKAKEYYTKASSDPKYGAEAKKMLDALNR